MDIITRKKNVIYGVILAVMVWLLSLQNMLEGTLSVFSYIDEVAALAGALICAYKLVVKHKCRITGKMFVPIAALTVFVISGLAGNLLFGFQPFKSVIVDLYTNLKFFFAIEFGYFLFCTIPWQEMKRTVNLHAGMVVLLLFSVFIVDRFFDFFPSEYRYGLKSARLFFGHPTYLAGASAFLVCLLTLFFEKKNYLYIALALVMMAFTLRSKSIASAAVYVLLFLMIIRFKFTPKLWHIGVLVLLCIFIGWPQIRFYFMELSGLSARSLLLMTSLLIMKDYFPIGTGFATYASSEAAKHYSPVYRLYELHEHFELRDVNDIETTLRLIANHDWLSEQYALDPDVVYWEPFLCDTFWPIIFGQTGVLGTIAFLVLLAVIGLRCLKISRVDSYCFVCAVFALVYLLIASIAEPAFHNAVAVPLAVCMGIAFAKANAESVKRDKEFICLKEN